MNPDRPAFYSYVAVDSKGDRHSGQLEAGSRGAALQMLSRDGLVPVVLTEKSGQASLRQRIMMARAGRRSSIGAEALAALTQALASLLRAGISIDRAVAITRDLEADPAMRQFLDGIHGAIRRGAPLVKAFSESKADLPGHYVGMLRAGEAGGTLVTTLQQMAELLKRQQEVRQRVVTALIYPALLGVVVLVTVVVLITFVLPKFQSLFSESEAALPWSTQAVLAVGQFASAYWWAIGGGLAGLFFAALAYLRSAAGRRNADRWLLRSRWTLEIPVLLETGRLFRTLSSLLSSGVPLPLAMGIAQDSLNNRVLREALANARKRVKEGQAFTQAMAAERVFPAQAMQLARVGEETGCLAEMLKDAAELLEGNGQVRLERLMALLTPALTILMGLVVAGLVGSVLLGLLSINELAY